MEIFEQNSSPLESDSNSIEFNSKDSIGFIFKWIEFQIQLKANGTQYLWRLQETKDKGKNKKKKL
jgi:hypothetical protein